MSLWEVEYLMENLSLEIIEIHMRLIYQENLILIVLTLEESELL